MWGSCFWIADVENQKGTNGMSLSIKIHPISILLDCFVLSLEYAYSMKCILKISLECIILLFKAMGVFSCFYFYKMWTHFIKARLHCTGYSGNYEKSDISVQSLEIKPGTGDQMYSKTLIHFLTLEILRFCISISKCCFLHPWNSLGPLLPHSLTIGKFTVILHKSGFRVLVY